MVNERIAKLREQMALDGIDMYVIPTADYHESEYVGEHFKCRAYITGFTGSAGTAVITATEARLWTDGRYFIQAAAQLSGSCVELMKMGEPGVPVMTDYMADTLKAGQTMGFDGRSVSMGEGMEYAAIAAAAGASVKYDQDLVGRVWEDRPPLSEKPAWLLDVKYAGESRADKLARIREEMKACGATAHILTTLDDICWTLNMRGDDIDYFPMVLSYAIITMDSMELYMDERKLDESAKEAFAADGVKLHPYNGIYEDVKALAKETLLIDPGKLNYALYNNLPSAAGRVEKRNPEILMKAIKNDTEIANIKKAQIKDSIAHVRFMKWLKENVGKEGMTITEMSASDKLDELRAEMGDFIEPSFDPICSYGEHGAIVHYTSSPETDVELKEGGLFLTDTGAGFIEGSTDITRTYGFGDVPQVQKDDFTLVAMSNLRLANANFMKGCTGANLDMYARTVFWDRNLNFNHGTGHGVGYLLNIHEGPSGFRWMIRPGEAEPFHPGMIITDEPGVYIEGSHGIRLENELLCVEGVTNEYGTFYHFEPITYVPFDLDVINPEVMEPADKRYLNEYHKAVYETLAPYLTEDEKEWLAVYTREI